MDLREKRLAPLALALLVAIVAVPIVLAKGTSPAPAPVTTPTRTTADASPVIKSAPQAGPVESKLQTFSPRDPFEPTVRVSTTTGGTTTGTGTTKTTTTTTGTGTVGGGSTPTTTTPTTTGGGTPTTGGGTTTTPTPATKPIVYTYTVDIRFGPPDAVKPIKGVQRLELIPDDKNPKIVFLGVTTTGKTAAFLVDSTLSVETGGRCNPSPTQCTFLYLRPDGIHDLAKLTDQNGNTFYVRLLRIHQVAVAAANGVGGTGGRTGNSNRAPAFTGSADANQSTTPSSTTPGDTPPGEPAKRPSFRGFFADTVK
jgi:hypothetical protein